MFERAGYGLKTSVFRAVAEMLERLRAEPDLVYPWPSLETRTEREGSPGLRVVGYGSLVNADSAAVTLSAETVSSSRPVVAFGARRVFNYVMPPLVPRYGAPHDPRHNAALNAEATSDPEDLLNGVCITIPSDEIDAFRERETGYDLARVPCLEWGHPAPRPFPAWILCCPHEPRMGQRRTNDDLLPHHVYYRVCRAGAERFGDAFLRLWLETTRLADGVTPVSEWERDGIPEGD